MSGTAKLVTNLVGARLGDRYVLEEKIGAGGFAVVYRSLDTRIHKQVAIKVLDRAKVQNLRDIARFRNEAAIAASIDDEHVIKITDYGEEGTIFYYVMELLRGHTLRSVLGMHERLHWQRACDICEQVCCALELAHERTIIHRDIKPENIFVEFRRGAENVKLLDLGIAKVLHEWDGLIGNLSTTGDFIGSPAYMAPEQAKGTKHCDSRVDLYALGVVLYELVTGAVPFRGESAWETMLLHVEQPPPPLARRAPGVEFPPALEAVLLRALAKDPARRFQTAIDLRDALRAVRLSQPAVAYEPLVSSSGPLKQSGESPGIRAERRPTPHLSRGPAVAIAAPMPSPAAAPETVPTHLTPATAPTRTLLPAPAAPPVDALPLRWRSRFFLAYLTVGSLVATCATSTLATVTLQPDVLDRFQRPHPVVHLDPDMLDDEPEPLLPPPSAPAPRPPPPPALASASRDLGSPFDHLLLAPPEPSAPPEAGGTEERARPERPAAQASSSGKSAKPTRAEGGEAPVARRPTMATMARRAALVIKEACLITPFSPLKEAQYTVTFEIHPITGDIEGVSAAGDVPPLRQPECVKSRAKALVKSFSGAFDMKPEYRHSYTVVR
ncbi:serine/threonine-protein kinase [Nannocystis punicea]|uniref:Serine/threonine-protein kinase n=1 Tax=Nannocystis punicea TaxID=2995304 RepID=A0ABY7H3A2_9BACT|nr:serine/threonine-protein kinase [Nannocystis poenicansa]WAS93590.1 serine/threonine-protein kinase [Nannocystis poenicansa]